MSVIKVYLRPVLALRVRVLEGIFFFEVYCLISMRVTAATVHLARPRGIYEIYFNI